jgi:hypothetical protein
MPKNKFPESRDLARFLLQKNNVPDEKDFDVV